MPERLLLFDKKLLRKTLLVFFSSLFVCIIASVAVIANKTSADNQTIERMLAEKDYKTEALFSHLLNKLHAVSVLAQKKHTQDEFDGIARTIFDDPATLNFLVAPNGVVSEVYPMDGNEALVGLDLFADRPGSREAAEALETRGLVLRGPFDAIQGGRIVTGRLHVITKTPDGSELFWGLVSLTFKFPDVLEPLNLDDMKFHGIGYKIWKFDDYTGEKLHLAGCSDEKRDIHNFSKKQLEIPNTDWFFCIFPLKHWYSRWEALLFLLLGLCLSMFIATIAHKNTKIEMARKDMENLSASLNKMAGRFLEQSDYRASENLMADEIRTLAEIIDIDAISIRRYFQQDDGLYVTQAYRWENNVETPGNGGSVLCNEDTGSWEETFIKNSVVNGPIRLLPGDTAGAFKQKGIVSLLAVPTFIHGELWGVVVYEDHRKERYFVADHVEFLRSAAFLLSSALMRDEMTKTRAEQQELIIAAHKAIERQANWYKSILDSIPHPISVVDPNKHWIFINKTLEAFLGIKLDEVKGKPCSSLGIYVCSTPACGVECAKRGEKRTYFELGDISFLADVAVLKDTEENTTGYIEVVQDITEIKAMARQVDESVERLMYREMLMAALNKAAITFLSSAEEAFDETMTSGISPIAEAVGIHRLSVWRNINGRGTLSTGQVYRWCRDSKKSTEILPSMKDVSYAEFAPRWEQIFAAGESINGPVNLLPEAHLFSDHGTKSVFITSVSIHNENWGFVLFEDLHNERYCDSDQIEMLKSAAFLLANSAMAHEMAQKVAEAEELSRIMLNTSPICCQLWSTDFSIIDCNDAAVELYGFKTKQEFTDGFFRLSPEYQPDGQLSGEKALLFLKKAFAEGYSRFDWLHVLENGSVMPAEITLVRVDYRNTQLVAGYTRDLRDIKQMETRITHLKSEAEKAYICGLTEIYNRRYFGEEMARIIHSLSRSNGTLSLMLIDVDFFKKYNDTYGHTKGDECLKTIAEILTRTISRAEDFVARYGGEEFVIVLPNTDLNGAHAMAGKLLENIREQRIPHESSDVADIVTISIGATTANVQHKQTIDDYINMADKLLYKSKHNGRNRYTFESL